MPSVMEILGWGLVVLVAVVLARWAWRSEPRASHTGGEPLTEVPPTAEPTAVAEDSYESTDVFDSGPAPAERDEAVDDELSAVAPQDEEAPAPVEAQPDPDAAPATDSTEHAFPAAGAHEDVADAPAQEPAPVSEAQAETRTDPQPEPARQAAPTVEAPVPARSTPAVPARWRSPSQERRFAALTEGVFTPSRGTGSAYDDVHRFFARERYPLTTNRVREADERWDAPPAGPAPQPRREERQPDLEAARATASEATTAQATASERFPGGIEPLSDGSSPDEAYTIKGNARSMLFHPPQSPYFRRTRAEVWFRTETDAQAAGFKRFA